MLQTDLLDESDRLVKWLLSGNQVEILLQAAERIAAGIGNDDVDVDLTPFWRLDASIGGIGGMATKTNKVGFIGGIAVPAVQRYEAGFMAGLKTTNPTAYGTGGKNVADVYAGSFGDQPAGKLIAQTMIAQKCDILFHAAGATGNGMFEALKEAGGPAKGLWGIGCDVDMGKNPNLYPAGTLTCAIKHVDYATWSCIKSVVDGTFKSATTTLSLTDGGVGWAQDNVATVLSADQIAKIDTLRADIIAGTVVPPTDPKAVSAWTVPTGF